MPDLTGHTLTVTISAGYVKAEAVCHEPDGAFCRLICAEPGCDDDRGVPHPTDDGDEHPTKDGGYCNEALWLNEDDALEAHAGDAHHPLSDGMPIEIEWDGDTCTWRGLEPAPPTT